MKQHEKILSIKDLKVKFKTKNGMVNAVRGLSLSVYKGEIVGLIGESGSGKSVTMKSVLRFNDNDILEAKEINACGIDLLKLARNYFSMSKRTKYSNTKKLRKVRGAYVGYIPQDPMSSLNPTMRIGKQIVEAIKAAQKRKYRIALKNLKENQKQHKGNVDYDKLIQELKRQYKENIQRQAVRKRMFEILQFIGIKDIANNVRKYPDSFSGGMRQRIVIAIVVACEPDLIIADEPTTALDVIVQAKVISLIKRLRDELRISIVFISHNIALVANLCDYIYVMYAGKIIEQGTLNDIFCEPKHPYTWALIESIPDPNIQGELTFIPGTPPNMALPIHGDAFAPRNKYALKIDFEKEPPLFELSNTHKAATWLAHVDAPKIPVPDEVKRKIELARNAVYNKINNSDLDEEE